MLYAVAKQNGATCTIVCFFCRWWTHWTSPRRTDKRPVLLDRYQSFHLVQESPTNRIGSFSLLQLVFRSRLQRDAGILFAGFYQEREQLVVIERRASEELGNYQVASPLCDSSTTSTWRHGKRDSVESYQSPIRLSMTVITIQYREEIPTFQTIYQEKLSTHSTQATVKIDSRAVLHQQQRRTRTWVCSVPEQ